MQHSETEDDEQRGVAACSIVCAAVAYLYQGPTVASNHNRLKANPANPAPIHTQTAHPLIVSRVCVCVENSFGFARDDNALSRASRPFALYIYTNASERERWATHRITLYALIIYGHLSSSCCMYPLYNSQNKCSLFFFGTSNFPIKFIYTLQKKKKISQKDFTQDSRLTGNIIGHLCMYYKQEVRCDLHARLTIRAHIAHWWRLPSIIECLRGGWSKIHWIYLLFFPTLSLPRVIWPAWQSQLSPPPSPERLPLANHMIISYSLLYANGEGCISLDLFFFWLDNAERLIIYTTTMTTAGCVCAHFAIGNTPNYNYSIYIVAPQEITQLSIKRFCIFYIYFKKMILCF